MRFLSISIFAMLITPGIAISESKTEVLKLMSQQYQLQQQEIRTLCRQDPDARCAFRMQVVKSRTRDVMVRISTMLNDQRIDPESVYRQMLACSRKQVEVAMHYINCWERLSEYFELIPEEQVATQN